MSRKGYRLPERDEWMLACAAGATTDHSFGRSPLPLDSFAWNINNSNWRLWPCGLLKPNDMGMYDMHGNVMEWCNSPAAAFNSRELKGGSSKGTFGTMAIGTSEGYHPETAFYSVGFRVIRTIVDSEGK
jgi:formylglycine-generating enzyme required for sulfatase activity